MAFGKKLGSKKALTDSLKKGSGGFIKFIPKDGSLTVRFLQEPEDWINYREVFDPAMRRGWPLPDDESMAGFDPDLRQSSRYIANALDVENDRVIVLQMPKDLVGQLTKLYEKYGTMLDRDYEVFRSGTGLDTTYGAAPEDKLRRKVSSYTLLDLEGALEAAYNAVWADSDDEDEEDAKPKKPAAKSAAAKRVAKKAASKRVVDDFDEDDEEDEDEPEEDDEDIEEDDEAEEEAEDDEFDEEGESDEDEDEEADDEDAEEGDDEAWYTAEDLAEYSAAELKALAAEYNIVPTGNKRQASTWIDAIVNYEGEDDDEEEDEDF